MRTLLPASYIGSIIPIANIFELLFTLLDADAIHFHVVGERDFLL
jgi:hypothetical protein